MGRQTKRKNHRKIRTKLHVLFEFTIRWRRWAGDTYLPTDIGITAVPYESTSALLHIHAV